MGNRVPEFETFSVPAGSTLRFEGMDGWFGYLALSCAIEYEKILGSASAYVSGGIGKRLMQRQKLNLVQKVNKIFNIERRIGIEQKKSIAHSGSHTHNVVQ